MRRSGQVLATGLGVVAIAVGLLAVGSLGGTPAKVDGQAATAAAPAATGTAADPLTGYITNAQTSLRANPADYATWAALGLDYVQQAKVTVDPSYYTKAEGAIAKSLALNTTENFSGYAGQAALQAGRHDFAGALVSARRGIAINGSNSTLYGTLADALTQLGRYKDADAAVDTMNQLLPGVAAFTRASYAFELRGDIGDARQALQRAVQDSTSPQDTAFSDYYLGELSLNYDGDARAALASYRAGLALTPRDSSLLAGQARAEAALGQSAQAVAHYRAVVSAVPQPQYVQELGELEQSVGDKDAARQYALFHTEERLFQANGVALDVEPTLFEADHGNPAQALVYAAAGWKVRPFMEMADAYAWALYRNGRYAEALSWTRRAFVTGWPNALFLYHRGMVEHALHQDTAARADLTRALKLNPHFNVLQAPVARATLAALHG